MTIETKRGKWPCIALLVGAFLAGVAAAAPPKGGRPPGNVTLRSAGYTNVVVEWSPSPGALRYVVHRNGAPDVTIAPDAGFFEPQTNRFGWGDVGREPAMLHTYSVTAHFNAPFAPARSAPAQIVTPFVPAPRNFRAAVSGASTVSLTWNPMPEAGGAFRVIRNGGSGPAAFVASGSGYVDRDVPPGDYKYAVFAVVRLASGEEWGGEISNQVAVKIRPFNIVAVGDSVMWGQGLRLENKFATQVRDWAAAAVGKPASLHLDDIAHSGAVTFPEPGQEGLDGVSYPGEVPWWSPSIAWQIGQIAPSKVPADEVDLVLLDGCINNVGVTKILSPFTGEGWLRDATRGYCNAGMQNLLRSVAGRFPNAKIVVNGYFPVISRLTDMTSLAALWQGLELVVPIPKDPLIGAAVLAGYRARAAALSDLFYNESTRSLQFAASTVNASLGGNRIRFASVPFGPEHAYAAPSSLLWLIPVRGVVEDEMFNSRSGHCKQHQPASLTCYGASMGHPNAAGARAYANAIVSVAAQFVAEWRSAHGTAPAREELLIVRVQPGPAEPGGGMFVVTATDGPGGAPMQGSVVVDGRVLGPLGTAVRYAYRDTNPTDLLVEVNVPGRRTRSFIVPIRNQSVTVAMTNSGNPRTAVITATDALTGQRLSGTVNVQTSAGSVSGPTGQPFTYVSCGACVRRDLFGNECVEPGFVPCSGFVRVPGYPDAPFEDRAR